MNGASKNEIGIEDIVTPSMIKYYILSIPRKAENHFHTCTCDAPKIVRTRPYDAEILNNMKEFIGVKIVLTEMLKKYKG